MQILRTIVEGDKSLLLRRRDTHLELVLGNVVLLSSAALETELDFGRLARNAKHVIIGGLGFGATLRGVLEVADPQAKIVVVEKLATVIDVAKNEASFLIANALDDPRVELRQADILDVIAEASEKSIDAILLDVDNGPEWASFKSNARIYADASLKHAKTKLTPQGIYAVWSGYPADAFLGTLRKAGFVPRVEPLREGRVVRARAYIGRIP